MDREYRRTNLDDLTWAEEQIRVLTLEQVEKFLNDLINAVETDKSKLMYSIARDGIRAMIDKEF